MSARGAHPARCRCLPQLLRGGERPIAPPPQKGSAPGFGSRQRSAQNSQEKSHHGWGAWSQAGQRPQHRARGATDRWTRKLRSRCPAGYRASGRPRSLVHKSPLTAGGQGLRRLSHTPVRKEARKRRRASRGTREPSVLEGGRWLACCCFLRGGPAVGLLTWTGEGVDVTVTRRDAQPGGCPSAGQGRPDLHTRR